MALHIYGPAFSTLVRSVRLYCLADALLTPMLDYLTRMPGREWLAGRPGLAAYLQRMRQRPSGREVLVAPDFSELQPAG